MSYDSLGPVQLTFLRLMSSEAYQNFTYTCLNSAAWYDTTTASYASAIRLQGDNEEEFSVTNNKPNVLLDGCKVLRMICRHAFNSIIACFEDGFYRREGKGRRCCLGGRMY